MKRSFILTAMAAAWLGTTPVQAQTVAADLLPAYEVSTIVASMGMRPLDRPRWRNGRYVIPAIDRHGREVRVVLDAYDGRVIAVRPRARDYVYEPRYAPPPRSYPREAPYDPRFDAPPSPPAAVPGVPPSADDDDEFFDDERLQGSLMPRGEQAPRDDQPRAAPSHRDPAVTNSVPRRLTAIAPAERKDSPKAAAPMPRPRPALAKANDPATGQPATQRAGNPPAKSENDATPPSREAAAAQAGKPDSGSKDIRVIDLSKPKTPEKTEDKPGEAIRF